MVGIAQMARALGCGPRGRGFKSRYSPLRWNQKRIMVSTMKRLLAALGVTVVLFSGCGVLQKAVHPCEHSGPNQGYCSGVCNGGPHHGFNNKCPRL